MKWSAKLITSSEKSSRMAVKSMRFSKICRERQIRESLSIWKRCSRRRKMKCSNFRRTSPNSYKIFRSWLSCSTFWNEHMWVVCCWHVSDNVDECRKVNLLRRSFDRCSSTIKQRIWSERRATTATTSLPREQCRISDSLLASSIETVWLALNVCCGASRVATFTCVRLTSRFLSRTRRP